MSSPNSQTNSQPFSTQAIYWLLGIVALLGLLNLDRLPIAWNDEIQNLDPALVWHNTGKFCSPLWPNPGAEAKFLSYPPLIEAWHCLWLFVGKSPWLLRLPFLFFHTITAWLFYRWIRRLLGDNPNHGMWAFFLTALFLFDKSTGEIARSLRVETPILLLVMILVGNFHDFLKAPTHKRTLIIGFTLGCLAIAHLYTWPLVATALFLCILSLNKKQEYHQIPLLSVSLGLPLITFWLVLTPDWQDLKTQLFMQAADHSGQGLVQNITAFFLGRFYPYSLEQPYTIALHFLYFLISYRLIKTQRHDLLLESWLPLFYLSISLPMMLFMAPQHRYFPIQHLLGLLLIALYVKSVWNKHQTSWLDVIPTWLTQRKIPSFQKPLRFVVLLLIIGPYFTRQASALIQRTQRNPQTAIDFLNQNLNHIPTGDILGEPIANYWLAQSPNPSKWRYGFEFYPQHFSFDPDRPRYFLSRAFPSQLPFLSVVDSLRISPSKLQQSLSLPSFGHTYNGLYLYKIPSSTAWKLLTRPEILRITSGH